jgi:hypothetical protein
LILEHSGIKPDSCSPNDLSPYKNKELYLLVKNEGNVTIRSEGRWELKQAGKPGF